MLTWVFIFLVIAIIAAVFGFGGIAAGAAGIAKLVFFAFLVLFVGSLLIHLFDDDPEIGSSDSIKLARVLDAESSRLSVSSPTV